MTAVAGLTFTRFSVAARRARGPARLRPYELDGEDFRRLPLVERYSRLSEVLKGAPAALKLCEHIDDIEPAKIFEHTCRLGLEGIVAKKAVSTYVSGRCPSWRKVLNPNYVRGPSRAS
jgi:ATP-dependent DNA ligase